MSALDRHHVCAHWLALLLTTSMATGCLTVERLHRVPAGAGRETPPPALSDTMVKVGSEAPPIALPTHDGETFVLDEIRKHGPVVLLFYRGDWSLSCATQLEAFAAHQVEFGQLPATLVAIGPDTRAQAEDFALETGFNGMLLRDETRAVIRRYGVYDAENSTAWPTVFVVDREGIVRYRAAAATVGELPSPVQVLAATRAIAASEKKGTP